ncbi:porin [Oceanospirillaceae bacterium ASx5O]|nr:porin [Oceanospirillaceae bacterium ASx5O]
MLLTRKTYLAALIGAAVLTTGNAHSAGADTKPVFYGTINLSLDNEDLEGAKSASEAGRDQWSLNSNNSRLGVKQDIQLDNGLTAVLKAEFRINVDDGKESDGKTFSQRDIYAGLKGEFGQVIAGRFNTPLRAAEGKLDPFNHLRGDIDTVLGGQNRVDNIVQYSSPAFANTVVHAAFIPGENSDTDGDGNNDTSIADAYSIAAVFDNKSIYAALALDINQAAGTTTDGLTRSDRLQLAAGWNLGALKAGAIIQQAEDSDDSSKKDTAFILNGSYTLGKTTLKAQIGENKGDKTDNKRNLAAIGADYALDKKSYLYVAYSQLSADSGAAEADDKTLQIGFNQSF